MKLENTLKELGLTENEAKVYLANLELGPASVGEIGKKAKIKRTTVYAVAESLKLKGLLSEAKKGSKTFFVPEPPEQLLRLSEKRFEKIKTAFPELKSLFNASDTKPKLRFYEGKEGYMNVYDNVLEEKPKELWVLASYDDFSKHLDKKYEENWIKQRVKKKIALKWIDFATERMKQMKRGAKEHLRQIKFLPERFKFQSSFFIYNNKMVIVSGSKEEFMAVVIEHEEFSHSFKQLFQFLWSSL